MSRRGLTIISLLRDTILNNMTEKTGYVKRKSRPAGAIYPLNGRRIAVPADKAFDRLVFGKAQCVVVPSGLGVAGFRTLPEFAHVGAGKQRPVFLRLVLEDRRPLAQDLPGA